MEDPQASVCKRGGWNSDLAPLSLDELHPTRGGVGSRGCLLEGWSVCGGRGEE